MSLLALVIIFCLFERRLEELFAYVNLVVLNCYHFELRMQYMLLAKNKTSHENAHGVNSDTFLDTGISVPYRIYLADSLVQDSRAISDVPPVPIF